MRGRIVAQVLLAFMTAGCGGSALQEYTSPEGRYRVVFSGRPKIQEKTVPTALGPITAKIAITEDRSRTARMVMFADYPVNLVRAGDRDAMLEGACAGMVDEAKLTVLSKVTIALNRHPGREVSFESQPGRPGPRIAGRARLYLVGNRLYQVFIAAPSGQLAPEAIEEYFNSFALLDPIPPPMAPNMAIGPAPPGRPPVDRPGPAPIPRRQPGRIVGPRGRLARGPDPRRPPAPAPAPGPAPVLGFYHIPDPPTAPIELDIPGNDSTPIHPPAGPGSSGDGGSPRPGTTAGGASIRSFRWLDESADVVGGYGDAAESDGTKDQHFRLELELPANAIIESLVITSGGFHRWVTQPSDRYWPIAIFQRGRPIARSHVARVGSYSGPQAFDLYFNTGIGIGPGTEFDLEIVLSIGGGRVTLRSHCKRPERGTGPTADERPARPVDAPPSPLLIPAKPGPDPSTLGPGPAPTPEPRPRPRSEDRPGPTDDQVTTELPTLLRASSGGATIVSFAWIDRDEDIVGRDGRQIAPGGGKDEHYRLVMDLPAAAIIEEIAVTGGGGLRWTTRPSARFWPVAVLANQELKNRGQSLRVGAFSGRWAFDLYVESEGSIRPDHVFGIEVVVFIRGMRHHLTARCRRG